MNNTVINLYHTSNTTVIDAFDGAVANLCRQREKHGYKSFLLEILETVTPWDYSIPTEPLNFYPF